MPTADEEPTIYKVVVNHEEQYSIFPADRRVPIGWRAVGKVGPKDDCLKHIEEIWTDMRPDDLHARVEQLREVVEEAATTRRR